MNVRPIHMRHLILFILSMLPMIASAGSADAVVRGKTESGRTKLELRVGDIDGLVRSLKLTIDGETYSLSGDELLGTSTVIWDKANGVYVVVVNSPRISFRFWMIPKSERVSVSTSDAYRSRFAAIIQATDPRKKKSGADTPRITIGCTLDYSI